MNSPSVAIVGTGLAGTVLGRCLLKRGIQSILYEKKKAYKPSQYHGYGYAIKKSSLRSLLQFLELKESDSLQQIAVDIKGTAKVAVEDDECYQVNSEKLRNLLSQGLRIAQPCPIKQLNSDSGINWLKTGSSEHMAKFVVGADGVHSTVRGSIAPETELKVLSYVVYNHRSNISSAEWETIKPFFNGANMVQHHAGNAIFKFSLSSEGSQGESSLISCTYSRPATGDDDKLYRPNRSKGEAAQTPKEYFEEIASYTLVEPFATIFNPNFLKKTQTLHWLMRTSLISRSQLADAAKRGIVLVGEAAHSEPILTSSGASEAILDGMKLAEIIAEEQDLDTFYDARYDEWQTGIDDSVKRMEEMHSESKAML